MQDHAWIINVARGRHIVTDDLVDAPEAGQVLHPWHGKSHIDVPMGVDTYRALGTMLGTLSLPVYFAVARPGDLHLLAFGIVMAAFPLHLVLGRRDIQPEAARTVAQERAKEPVR